MSDTLRIDPAKPDDGRFHRQELITWWDQKRLQNAKVLVIGAGALGNEILKNLALVGVGRVLVADMDTIELSNLARSVLFRESDIGLYKAEVAAERAMQLCPQMQVSPFVGNIVYDLGLGVFRWADITICGLDNREARVAVNSACLKVGKPWIDGAIERLDGVFRFFAPDAGACYECTMSETDWQMLEARRSCALLTRDQLEHGHTPTTATSSSIVAGLQCQEMLKYLHGQPIEGGTGIVINGQTNDIYPVTYTRKADCEAHDPLPAIKELPTSSSDTTLAELLRIARNDLGAETVLELGREIIHSFQCGKCGTNEEVFASLGKTTEEDSRCPACRELRFPQLLHSIDGSEGFLKRNLRDISLPPYDIVVGRNGFDAIGYLFSEDEQAVFRADFRELEA